MHGVLRVAEQDLARQRPTQERLGHAADGRGTPVCRTVAMAVVHPAHRGGRVQHQAEAYT